MIIIWNLKEGSNGEGGKGEGCRKFSNEDFYNLPCVWNIIIIIIQEKEMSWVRHLALKGEMNRASLVETAEIKRPLTDF